MPITGVMDEHVMVYLNKILTVILASGMAAFNASTLACMLRHHNACNLQACNMHT